MKKVIVAIVLAALPWVAQADTLYRFVTMQGEVELTDKACPWKSDTYSRVVVYKTSKGTNKGCWYSDGAGDAYMKVKGVDEMSSVNLTDMERVKPLNPAKEQVQYKTHYRGVDIAISLTPLDQCNEAFPQFTQELRQMGLTHPERLYAGEVQFENATNTEFSPACYGVDQANKKVLVAARRIPGYNTIQFFPIHFKDLKPLFGQLALGE